MGSYKEPLGGHPVLLSTLPIDAVEPTPFQRDLSDAHHKRLADVINKTGRFLDPIAVVAPKGFWTPNGRHRLEAMRRLGAKSITALVVADREVAWQILALNTEKAHNLKERSLEVIRIYRGLGDEDATRPESGFAFYLDEPALVTLGVCYERVPDLVAVLTIQSCGDWRPLPMNRSALPSRITRNEPRWCSTSRRKFGSGKEAEKTWPRQPVPALVRSGAHQSAALDCESARQSSMSRRSSLRTWPVRQVHRTKKPRRADHE